MRVSGVGEGATGFRNARPQAGSADLCRMHQEKLKAYISKIVRVLSLPDAPRKDHSIHLKVVRVLRLRDAPRKGQSIHLTVVRVLSLPNAPGQSQSAHVKVVLFYVCRMHQEKLNVYISKIVGVLSLPDAPEELTAYISKLFGFHLVLAGCATKRSRRTCKVVRVLSSRDAPGQAQSVHLKDCSSFIFAGCTTKSSQHTSQS